MNNKPINKSSVKLSGDYFETDHPVESGTGVVFQGKGAVVNETYTDNHDGTFDFISTIKAHYLEVKTDEIGIAPVRLTKTGVASSKSMSKRYRDKLHVIYQLKHSGGSDFEAFYERHMEGLLGKLNQVIDQLQGNV